MPETFTAVYDLSTSPPQFDFQIFLVSAEIERIRRGADRLRIIAAPGPREGFRDNLAWPEATADRRRLVEAIMRPLVDLLPSAREHGLKMYRGSRSDLAGEWGYGEKFYGVAQVMRVLSSPHGRPFRLPRPVPRDFSRVTMTLRESPHWPDRNSDVAEWVTAANVLAAEGFDVIMVRDTAKAGDRLPGLSPAVSQSASASHYLDYRAGLYASAAVNLFVSNGPAGTCRCMGEPVAMLKPWCETHPATRLSQLAGHGLTRGAQWPNSPAWQRIVWEEDTCEAILAAARHALTVTPPADPMREAA